MTVLIIDNSIQVIEALANLLVDTGIPMDIIKAVNRVDGFILFKEKQPGIVVMDWNLPGNESPALLRDIKATGIKTAVIALSVATGKRIKDEYKLPGVDFTLDKYGEFEKIPGIISALAERAGDSL